MKNNSNNPVTMEVFDKTLRKIDERFDRNDERFKFHMKIIDERFDRIEANMYTKADHAKFMEWMDEAMTELRDAREDRQLNSKHIARLDDVSFDHEKRICVLEAK